MLSKKKRLKSKEDYHAVFRRGWCAKGEALSVCVKKNTFNYARFGFIVGTRVAKKAVLRNLIKRRLRSAARRVSAISKDGFDCVITARPKAAGASFAEILTELETLLKNKLKL